MCGPASAAGTQRGAGLGFVPLVAQTACDSDGEKMGGGGLPPRAPPPKRIRSRTPKPCWQQMHVHDRVQKEPKENVQNEREREPIFSDMS